MIIGSIAAVDGLPEQYQKLFVNVLSPLPNRAPRHFEELTEKEFAQSSFFSYSPIARGYSQFLTDYEGMSLTRDGKLECISVVMYFMHDGTGYGMSADFWEGKVHFYRFGCNHDYQEYARGEATLNGWPHDSFLHNTRCKKCGHFHQYDSSD